MDTLTKKKTDRFRFLNRLYEVTDGNKMAFVSMWDLGNDLQMTREETAMVADYLSGEHLIEHRAIGGIISISHYGVIEVERSLSEPETPTRYFPAVVNVLNINNMSGSQIQQGTHHSSQTLSNTINDTEAIRLFIESLKANLSEISLVASDLADIKVDIQTVEAQLQSSRPKLSILRESLHSIRTILESVASSAITSELLPRLLPILASFGS